MHFLIMKSCNNVLEQIFVEKKENNKTQLLLIFQEWASKEYFGGIIILNKQCVSAKTIFSGLLFWKQNFKIHEIFYIVEV